MKRLCFFAAQWVLVLLFIISPLLVHAEEIQIEWTTSITLNQEQENVWENFRDLIPKYRGDNDIDRIKIVLEYAADSAMYVAKELKIYKFGEQNASDIFLFEGATDISDNVLQVFLAAKGENVQRPSRTIWSLDDYPVFVRELTEGILLDEEVDLELEGTSTHVFEDYTKKSQFFSFINSKLGLNLDKDSNFFDIEMITRPNGSNIEILGLRIIEKANPNNMIQIGSNTIKDLWNQNPGGSLLKQIWERHYRPGSDLDRKIWPKRFDIRFTFKKNGSVYQTESIEVKHMRGNQTRIYKDQELNVIANAANSDLQAMAQKIIDQTNLMGDNITAVLTNKYSVNELPPEGSPEYIRAKANSYSLVSFYSLSIDAFDEVEPYEKTVYDPMSEYNSTIDPDAVYDILHPKSGYWREEEVLKVPPKKAAPPDTVSPNLLVLGFDRAFASTTIKDNKLSFGMKIGQEEFNYPFSYSGSPHFFINWRFSEGISNITKIIDNVSFAYRIYSPMLNRYINEYEEALDSKYTNRNDDIDRRISLENLEFKLQKTIRLDGIGMLRVPFLSHMTVGVPFQLPVSYRKYFNIGGDKNIIGAATYNNNYTYIEQYKGVTFDFFWNHKAGKQPDKFYLNYFGISYYKISEMRHNTIQDGRLYTGQMEDGEWSFNGDNPDKIQQVFLEAQIGVPGNDLRYDKFNLKYRLGVGDRMSHMLTTHFRIIDGFWWDIKIALYEKDTFAYERVMTFGPVFKLDY